MSLPCAPSIQEQPQSCVHHQSYSGSNCHSSRHPSSASPPQDVPDWRNIPHLKQPNRADQYKDDGQCALAGHKQKIGNTEVRHVQ